MQSPASVSVLLESRGLVAGDAGVNHATTQARAPGRCRLEPARDGRLPWRDRPRLSDAEHEGCRSRSRCRRPLSDRCVRHGLRSWPESPYTPHGRSALPEPDVSISSTNWLSMTGSSCLAAIVCARARGSSFPALARRLARAWRMGMRRDWAGRRQLLHALDRNRPEPTFPSPLPTSAIRMFPFAYVASSC